MTRSLLIGRNGALGAAGLSTQATEQLFGGQRTEVRLTESLMSVARIVWPNKTAANVASRAVVSTRAAEMWLAGDRAMSGEQYRLLLCSEHGLKFAQATIPSDRSLWSDFAREMRRAELEAQINALQKEYDDRFAGR